LIALLCLLVPPTLACSDRSSDCGRNPARSSAPSSHSTATTRLRRADTVSSLHRHHHQHHPHFRNSAVRQPPAPISHHQTSYQHHRFLPQPDQQHSLLELRAKASTSSPGAPHRSHSASPSSSGGSSLTHYYGTPSVSSVYH